MSKEQLDFWPKDAEDARVRAGVDWMPDDDATRDIKRELSYKARRKKMREFLRNTTRNLAERAKLGKNKT